MSHLQQQRPVLIGLLAVSALMALSCQSSSSANGAAESNATEALPSQCTVVSTKLGRNMTADELAQLDDPIAKLVLRAPGVCPTSFEEIQNTLRKTDAIGCPDDPAAPPAGVVTALVSDRSQLLGKADNYRSVTWRQCAGRAEHELLISNQTLVPAGAGALPSLPHGMVILGQDHAKGVFHFYVPGSNGSWQFIGDSTDMIGSGYNCNATGGCSPKKSLGGCNGCHLGGGLNMIELHTPWVSWEGPSSPTPGASDVISAFGQFLGRRTEGRNLERVVLAGNTEWVKARVKFLKELSTQELLRPLFCTIDVNVQSSRQKNSVGAVPIDYFLDPRWEMTAFIPVNPADYSALIAANKQKISSRAQLNGPSGPIVDTFFPFTFPERSDQDQRYVSELVAAGVVDEDFVRDVLFTDFTRPVFSGPRCSLVALAPTLTAANSNPTSIREGFKASLAASAVPAAKELAARLGDPNDGAAHASAVAAYVAACKARDPKALLTDVLEYASHLRNAARGSSRLFSAFPEELAVDSVPPDTSRHFTADTCELK